MLDAIWACRQILQAIILIIGPYNLPSIDEQQLQGSTHGASSKTKHMLFVWISAALLQPHLNAANDMCSQ